MLSDVVLKTALGLKTALKIFFGGLGIGLGQSGLDLEVLKNCGLRPKKS